MICLPHLATLAGGPAADMPGLTLLNSAPLLLGSSYRKAPESQDAVSVQCRQYGRGALHHVPALQVTVPVIDRLIVGTARPALGP